MSGKSAMENFGNLSHLRKTSTRRVWTRLRACAVGLLFVFGMHLRVNASGLPGRRQATGADHGAGVSSPAPANGTSTQSTQGNGGKDNKGDSAALLQEARTAFESGNLPEAAALAAQVTSPELKAAATGILNRVSNYNAAIAAAQGAERAKDTGRAIHLYTSAANIAHNGPGDPTGHIAALRAGQTASSGTEGAAASPVTPASTPSSSPPPVDASHSPTNPASADTTAQTAPVAQPSTALRAPQLNEAQLKVNRLLAAAHGAEAAGDLPSALKGYEEVEHLQPGNGEGAAGHLRVEAAIHRDPAEQAKTLAQAIRDFYSLKYGDTEDELTSYLSSPKARSRGAAYFYLGATRLYRRVLEGQQTPEAAVGDAAVQRSLKEAKALGYQPLARFVSPLLMQAWQRAQ